MSTVGALHLSYHQGHRGSFICRWRVGLEPRLDIGRAAHRENGPQVDLGEEDGRRVRMDRPPPPRMASATRRSIIMITCPGLADSTVWASTSACVNGVIWTASLPIGLMHDCEMSAAASDDVACVANQYWLSGGTTAVMCAAAGVWLECPRVQRTRRRPPTNLAMTRPSAD